MDILTDEEIARVEAYLARPVNGSKRRLLTAYEIKCQQERDEAQQVLAQAEERASRSRSEQIATTIHMVQMSKDVDGARVEVTHARQTARRLVIIALVQAIAVSVLAFLYGAAVSERQHSEPSAIYLDAPRLELRDLKWTLE